MNAGGNYLTVQSGTANIEITGDNPISITGGLTNLTISGTTNIIGGENIFNINSGAISEVYTSGTNTINSGTSYVTGQSITINSGITYFTGQNTGLNINIKWW